MDRYEYKLKVEQLEQLQQEKDFETAAEIADTINWRKVKSAATLCMVGEIYDRSRRYEDSREILLMAYDRAAIGRNILYRLTLVALKMGNIEEAKEYYEEFVDVAPHDNSKYILQYQIAKLEGASLEEQIAILEEFKERDFREEWAFELAYLYHCVGEGKKCVEACDEIVLWFGDGKYVEKALEMKILHQPLTPEQEEKYRQFQRQKKRQRMAGRRAGAKEGPEAEAEGSALEGEPEAEGGALEEKPEARASSRRFHTSDLQAELAKSMQQIKEADTQKAVSDTMDNIRRMLKDSPYLQMPEPKQPSAEEERQFGHIETEEEIDQSLNSRFQEYLAEEWDGQYRMYVPAGIPYEPQVAGQMHVDEVLSDWEKTRRAYEAVMEDAKQRKLESAKARAWRETSQLMDSLKHMPDSNAIDSQAPDGEFDGQFYQGAPDSGAVNSRDLPLGQPDHTWDGAEEQPYAWDNADGEPYARDNAEEQLHVADDREERSYAPDDMGEQSYVRGSAEEQFHIQEEAEEQFHVQEEAEEQFHVQDEVGKQFHIQEEAQEQFHVQDEVGKQLHMQEEAEEQLHMQEEAEEQLHMQEEAEEQLHIQEEAEEERKGQEYDAQEEALQGAGQQAVGQQASGVARNVSRMAPRTFRDWDIDSVRHREMPYGTPNPNGSLRNGERRENRSIIPLEKLIEKQARQEPVRSKDKDAEECLESAFRAAKASREEKHAVPPIEEEPKGAEARLSEEQRKIFSYFVPVIGMEQQLCRVLDGVANRESINGSSSNGNIIITGGKGSGKTVLATDFIRAIQNSGGHLNGKVGKITGASLNQKDLGLLLKKVAGGYLMIERAGEMNHETVARLALLMDQDTNGLLVILEDTRKEMEKVLSLDANFAKKFTEWIKIPVFTSDELVEFAKAYAAEQECEIDDMGILALYNRISSIQKLDEATTLTEVKEIVDEAISSAERGGLKKIFGRKKFSPEGYLYLRERDFDN